jgi:hypothetical protein
MSYAGMLKGVCSQLLPHGELGPDYHPECPPSYERSGQCHHLGLSLPLQQLLEDETSLHFCWVDISYGRYTLFARDKLLAPPLSFDERKGHPSRDIVCVAYELTTELTRMKMSLIL